LFEFVFARSPFGPEMIMDVGSGSRLPVMNFISIRICLNVAVMGRSFSFEAQLNNVRTSSTLGDNPCIE